MISRKLADLLHAHGVKHPITLNTILKPEKEMDVEYVDLRVSPTVPGSTEIYPVSNAHGLEQLNDCSNFKQNRLNISCWPHLADVKPHHTEVQLDAILVLIGQDVPQAHKAL